MNSRRRALEEEVRREQSAARVPGWKAALKQVTPETRRSVFVGLVVFTALTTALITYLRTTVGPIVDAFIFTAVSVSGAWLYYKWSFTERKVAEQYRWMDSVTKFALIILGADGKIREWNRGAEQLTGFSVNEAVGRTTDFLFEAEDVSNQLPEDALRLANVNGTKEETGWRRRRDGERFWASSVTTALRDRESELIGYSVIIRDRTVEKVAQDELLDQSRLLGTVVNGTVDVIFLKDHELRYQLINAAGTLLIGAAENDIIGKTDEELLGPDAAATNRRHDVEVMTTGVSEIIEQEFELRNSKHLLLFHRTPWRDRAGRTIGVIGIATDITHRKARVRADADLAQLV